MILESTTLFVVAIKVQVYVLWVFYSSDKQFAMTFALTVMRCRWQQAVRSNEGDGF